MPAPAKVDIEAIVAAARDVLEQHGAPGLTMQAVATRLGIRAPSLYKHVRDRDDLVLRVRDATLAELAEVLASADGDGPGDRVVAQLRAARAFAHERPHGMAVAFESGVQSASMAALDLAVEPLLVACESLVGEREALHAARTVTAWMHGFIDMERSGAFRLGGELEDAYEYGARTIVAALEAGAR